MRPPRNPLSGSHCKIQIPKKARARVLWGLLGPKNNPQPAFNRLIGNMASRANGASKAGQRRDKASKQATPWQDWGHGRQSIPARKGKSFDERGKGKGREGFVLCGDVAASPPLRLM